MAQINEWLSISQTSGTGNATVTLTAATQEALTQRISSLTISGSGVSAVLNIVQEAAAPYVNVIHDTMTFDGEGEYKANIFKSNVEWIAYADESWISMNVASGSSGTNGRIITCTANSSLSGRSGTIYVTDITGTELYATITINQRIYVPNNMLIYTSTNGNVISASSIFGQAIVVSNTYDNGFGVIVFDRDLTMIPALAFQNRSTLSSINISNSVTSIGNEAFENCSSLSSITMSNGVTSIGNYAFSDCSNLTSINISEGVTSIGDSIFRYCSSLSSITIPDSVTSIERYAFGGCSSLSSINIPDSVTSIETGAFSNCSSLTSITIPDSVTNIEYEAFRGCSGLTSITIPDSVTFIGYGVFRDTNITNAFIGSGLSLISGYAFSGSPLSLIIIARTQAPSIDGNYFRNIEYNGLIIYPQGSDYTVWLNALPNGWTERELGFNVDVSNFYYNHGGGSTTFNVYSYNTTGEVSWYIDSKPNWCTLSPSSGAGITNVILTIGTASEDRTGNIILQNSNGDTVTLTVYQEEYHSIGGVKSNGNSYVNTEYVPTINTEVEVKFRVDANNSSWQVYYGSQSGDDTADMYCLRKGNGDNLAARVGDGYATASTYTTGVSYTTVMNKNGLTVNGSTAVSFTATTLDADLPIYIGASNNLTDGGAWRYSKASFGEFIIRESGVVVRDLKPAIVNNTVCFYDVITHRPFVPVGDDLEETTL